MKILSFYRLSVLASILFASLASILIFVPEQMLTSWGIALSTETGLLMNRIGALYVGIAVMFFLARNAEHSPTRSAIIYGTATACMILALLGVYEFAVGHAASGILIGVFIEVTLMFALLYVGIRRQ